VTEAVTDVMGVPAIALALGGYTDLPPGVIAAVTTYLEMTARPPRRPVAPAPNLTFVRLDPRAARALAEYRDLYSRIGRDLMWFSRAGLSKASLAALLGADGIEIWLVRRDGAAIGLVELDYRDAAGRPGDETEIVYFGLVPEAIGGGSGRWMMEQALDRAFARTIRRLWLHTCHYDHPAALDFYRRSGFTPYKTAIELAPDPRLSGCLPRDAAPQIPLIEPNA
jgi:ribosomal protein S18 acetylase RimI-like enzyme